jgi:hypothetical protein
MSILEAHTENNDYLNSLEEIEPRIAKIEVLLDNLEKRLFNLDRIVGQINSLQDTVNLTLANFSKRLIKLEESKTNRDRL